jgi:hypothetical protein
LAATQVDGVVDLSVLQRDLQAEDAARRAEAEEDFETDFSQLESDQTDGERNLGRQEELRRVDKLQFRQISVGEGQSCGITLLGTHLMCWGDKSHKPFQVAGPFRQVSVGRLGVCAISARKNDELTQTGGVDEADHIQCWGFARMIVDLSGLEQVQWDQISVGDTTACAVSMDSELKCWGNTLPPEFDGHPSKYIVA